MEFGIFIPSARNGYIMSETAPQYSPTYDHMREIITTGEDNGFPSRCRFRRCAGTAAPPVSGTTRWNR
ncbi:hypothetical protein [Amycolatopsis sp. Poz14]|uniref:hypothetical protein n=1 Tax=Amycolatopsis sp. Poz14 TaxID=1447705 RepID=UPI001EE97B80|nr:hypothetical protein [Amycolatopsis sp. Poz14]MCG3754038.1 hypothetical protein [Amycolatopsis sp. Poz14]